ncbi:hypothetical protein JXA32_15380 [Candidatus Sumerlaeota bacterium]|nr:hypothetical protein [Candidatus Sumerlaeota bacterium]
MSTKRHTWLIMMGMVLANIAFAQEPSSDFQKVEQRLDRGGVLYVYMDIEDVMQSQVETLTELMSSTLHDPKAEEVVSIIKLLSIASGLYGIEDVGASSIREEDHYLNKIFLHIPSERRKGLLESLGGEPHAFDLLRYAPAQTELFHCEDLNFGQLVKGLRETFAQHGTQKQQSQLEGVLMMLQMQLATNLDTLLEGLGDEYALLLDFDEEEFFPSQPAGMKIPFVDVALLVRVKNDAPLRYLTGKFELSPFPMGEYEVEGIPVKVISTPPDVPFSPAVGQHENILILASSQEYLGQIIGAHASSENLGSNPEFQRMFMGLPAEGNGMHYSNGRLRQVIAGMFLAGMENATEEQQKIGMQVMSQMLLDGATQAGEKPAPNVMIRVNLPDGAWWIARSPNRLSPQALMMTMNGPAAGGILTAIAIPSFIRARETARGRACQENLSKLDGAKWQYALDNNLNEGDEIPGGIATLVGPNNYLRTAPKCPSGGKYTLNPIGQYPECSHKAPNWAPPHSLD